MSWFKIDDGFWGHEKVTALSDAALALWVQAGSWTARYRKDGSVPRDICKRLGRKTRAVRELIVAGLWVETSEGYAFHDFDKWQKQITRADDNRERDAERQRNSRMSDRTPIADENGRETTVTRDPVLPSLPIPTHKREAPAALTVAVESTKAKKPRQRTERDDVFDLARDCFEAAHTKAYGAPQGVNPGLLAAVVSWLLAMPSASRAETLQRAVEGFFADPHWTREGRHPLQAFSKAPGSFLAASKPSRLRVAGYVGELP